MRHAYERIWNTVLKIAEENKGKTVAAATHGGVLRCLNCRILHGGIEHLKETPWCENTAVNILEFDDNFNPSLVLFNDISHLPDGMIQKRSRLSEFMGEKR